MSSFTLFSSIGIVLNCFYLLIFYFVEFWTFYLSLSFSVCRSGDSKSLYWSDVSAAYRTRRFSLGHSADVQSWTISITLVLSWSCLVKFFQPVRNSSDAVWTKTPSQPFFWMSRNVGKALRDIQKTAASETAEHNVRRNKLSLQGKKSSGYAHFWNTHLNRREVVMCESKSNVTLTWQHVPQGARALNSGHRFQYSEIEVIYPWAFAFLSRFWKRFVSWPRLFLRGDFKIQSGIAFSKFYSVYSFWSVKKQPSRGNEFRVSILK